MENTIKLECAKLTLELKLNDDQYERIMKALDCIREDVQDELEKTDCKE